MTGFYGYAKIAAIFEASDGDLLLKFLLTNDDGIESQGLWAVVDVLTDIGDVFVVAPDREQSGVGASLTLHDPIRVKETGSPSNVKTPPMKTYAVQGTPGDCVILGLEQLVGPVDTVISGINNGSNLGHDLFVSGTVGGAFHGFARGCLSIAISVAALKATRYDVACSVVRQIALMLVNGVSIPPYLLNINLPNKALEEIKGLDITTLGGRSYAESVSRSGDSRRDYYWISRGTQINSELRKDTDIVALRDDKISITPVAETLTDTSGIPLFTMLFDDLYGAISRIP